MRIMRDNDANQAGATPPKDLPKRANCVLFSEIPLITFSHDPVALYYTLGSICSMKRLSIARYSVDVLATTIDSPRAGATDDIFLFGGIL